MHKNPSFVQNKIDVIKRSFFMDKNNTDKKSWLMTKSFYGVVFAILLAIAGISMAIINVAKVKDIIPEDKDTTHYSVTAKEKTTADFQANAEATGIPDERTMPTTKATHNDLNAPYSGYYILPVNSSVSKDYSGGTPVYSETMGDWREHSGIDLKAEIGENVIAVQDGTVKDVISDELWGGIVVIEHGNGLTARYCGVKANVVKDLPVEQGQVIGTVVAIPVEAKDGVHVHLETEVEGKTVDPVKALNLLGDSQSATTEE